MIQRFLDWLLDWLIPKRRRRRAIIRSYRRAADSYREMAAMAANVKPITWAEYCNLMAVIRDNDADTWEKLS